MFRDRNIFFVRVSIYIFNLLSIASALEHFLDRKGPIVQREWSSLRLNLQVSASSYHSHVLVEVADALQVGAGKSLIILVNVVGVRGFDSPAPPPESRSWMLSD